MRPRTSSEPPAGTGTTILIGPVCGKAAGVESTSAINAAAQAIKPRAPRVASSLAPRCTANGHSTVLRMLRLHLLRPAVFILLPLFGVLFVIYRYFQESPPFPTSLDQETASA